MSRICLVVLATALALAPPLVPLMAQTAPTEQTTPASQIDALSQAMLMGDVFAVMVQEGQDYGTSIETQMFPGQGGTRWADQVAAIYDPATLQGMFEARLQEELADDPETVVAALAFFDTPRMQTILKLEVEARRALLDTAVEEAAEVEAERMQAARDPKMRLIRDMIKASDLIEMNVAGALSANLAFLEGMASVRVPGAPMDREGMMTEVWSQESSIRDETSKWLVPFLALAYGPAPEADLQAYLEFAASPEGKRLNGAVYAAFDKVFAHVSYQLGRSAALMMIGNDT
ncbi:MAG: hypothetical protein WAT09_00850 [Paracoccaceae bacterium]